MCRVRVLKFGGTSVGQPDRIHRVVEIVARAAESCRPVVVVSAAGGVTDMILDSLDGAAESIASLPARLRERHLSLAAGVLPKASLAGYREVVDTLIHRLEEVLDGIPSALLRGFEEAPLRDEIVATGERLSVPLVARALTAAGVEAFPQDAAELIRTDDTFGDAVVDIGTSYRLVRTWFASLEGEATPVVTGFIGSTAGGKTTTLGRGGSDYTAALLAGAVEAAAMERWTDVDGLYTDDPRRNGDARLLAYIVLEEAAAWNHAGRLGMHRKALDPLVTADIPVFVRSTTAPDEPGTAILPAGYVRASLAS